MEFERVVGGLGLEAHRDFYAPEWELSERTFEPEPFFLMADYIRAAAAKAEIDEATARKCQEAAAAISGNPSLKRLIWHQHHLMFKSERSKAFAASKTPERIDVLGDATYAYNLLLVLSGFPKADLLFKRFPADVLRGALIDAGLWCAHFAKTLGICGITPRILGWEHGLLHEHLYRLGRLQFNVRPFEADIHVFRNRRSGQVQALARGGAPFNSDGQIDGVDGVFDKAAWISELTRDSKKASGNPVSPLGRATRERLSLDLSEWDDALAPGDPIVDVHIPAGAPFTTELCADAFDRALKFFPEYFPGKRFKGFSCHSWFLDVQYDGVLPESSNIVAFQRNLYLFPIREGGEDSLWRIFGENGLKNGLENAPRTSSMQRAVAGFLEKGGRLRSGGGFLLLGEMPYGRQPYRGVFPALSKTNGSA